MSTLNTIERVFFEGDNALCSVYLPFARKKSLEALQRKEIKRYYDLGTVKIFIKVVNNMRFINISATSKSSYTNGILKDCLIVDTSIFSFFPKNSSNWKELQKFGIQPSDDLIAELYPFNTLSQHSQIKPTQFSGIMRYAVQMLYGTSKQLNFKCNFKETDGLLYEEFYPKGQLNTTTNSLEYWYENYDFRLVKVNADGVFLKKALNTVPTPVKKFSSPITWSGQNGNEFETVLNDTSFTIPTDEFGNNIYSTNVNDDGVFKLDIDMSGFYSKVSHFTGCSWLFPYNRQKEIINTDNNGNTITKRYNVLMNTCYQGQTSYLYGINITQTITQFSDQFLLTEDYINNVNYIGKLVYLEYTAELIQLHSGHLNSLEDKLPWINTKSGINLPNYTTELVEEKVFNGSVLTNNGSGLVTPAPIYITQDSFYGGNHLVCNSPVMNFDDSSITNIEKSIINSYGIGNLINTSRLIPLTVSFSGSIPYIDIEQTVSPYLYTSKYESEDGFGNILTSGNIFYSQGGITSIPNYDREGLINSSITKSNIYYSLINETVLSVNIPEPSYEESFITLNGGISNHNIPLNITYGIVSSSSFKFNLYKDTCSKKYGIELGSYKYYDMFNSYPQDDIPYLTFIGKP